VIALDLDRGVSGAEGGGEPEPTTVGSRPGAVVDSDRLARPTNGPSRSSGSHHARRNALKGASVLGVARRPNFRPNKPSFMGPLIEAHGLQGKTVALLLPHGLESSSSPHHHQCTRLCREGVGAAATT
jgi:hypothetical protein